MKREKKCKSCRYVKAGSILGLTPTPRMRLWFQTVRAMWLNWMAGWLAGQATLECRVFCLSERGVGQGENAIDDSREKERNSRKCSLSLFLSPLPHSSTPILSLSLSVLLSLSFSVCENLHRGEPLSRRPRSPGTTTALSCPVNKHPSSPLAPTFARATETRGCSSCSYPHQCSYMDVCVLSMNAKLLYHHRILSKCLLHASRSPLAPREICFFNFILGHD